MGKNLSNEHHFLDDSKKEIESNVSDVYCSFYLGKKSCVFQWNLDIFQQKIKLERYLNNRGKICLNKKTSVDRLLCILYDRLESSSEIYC